MIKQSRLRRAVSLMVWRKGNCEAQTPQTCLEGYLKRRLNTSCITNLFENSLVQMSWILFSKSCTFETDITILSESCNKVEVSNIGNLKSEISCSVSKVVWTAVLMPVGNWKWLIHLLMCNFQIPPDVCAVLALYSWIYCSEEQGPIAQYVHNIAQSSLYSWLMYINEKIRCCHLMVTSLATRWHTSSDVQWCYMRQTLGGR